MLNLTNLFANKITVNVDNIDEKKDGQINIFVFKDDSFPKVHSKAIYMQTRKVTKNKEVFHFEISNDFQEIAIKVHHDENLDGMVTKNWTGIYPKEGLGFSNNQKLGFLGPPNYKNSKLNKEQFLNDINITVIYP